MLSRLDPRIRSLLLRLPLAAAAALLAWYAALEGAWGTLVAGVTEPLVRLFERTPVTRLTLEGTLLVVSRSDLSSDSALPSFALAPITVNLVLLLALLWATPRTLRAEGLWRIAAALGALLASHVLHLILTVETLYATSLGPWSVAAYPRWQREVLATGRYFFDIALKYALPFVLWALTLDLAPFEERTARAPRRRKR